MVHPHDVLRTRALGSLRNPVPSHGITNVSLLQLATQCRATQVKMSFSVHTWGGQPEACMVQTVRVQMMEGCGDGWLSG